MSAIVLTKKRLYCYNLYFSSAWGGDQLLPAVTCHRGPAVRTAGGTAVRLPCPSPLLGLRGHRVSPHRLPGGHPVGRPGLHLHVDQCGQVPGSSQAAPVRDSTDQDPLPMLDGLHLDIGGHDVLSTPPGV